MEPENVPQSPKTTGSGTELEPSLWTGSTHLRLIIEMQEFGPTTAGRDWGQEEKGMTEDEMAGWHHRLHGHVFE